MSYFEKHFTLEEAQALLPAVRDAFSKIDAIRESLAKHGKDIESLMKASDGNGGGKGSADYLDDILALNSIMSELTREGILIKDLGQGLVDFPCMRDGREVFLCWRVGEDTISYWHELETGFAGRQAL